MDKQTPSTSVQHNDALSEALISSYKQWMDGDTFQQSTVEEEKVETPIGSYEKPAFDTGTIPTCDKSKEKGDDVSTKDPKEKAGSPDPATSLVGSMTIGQGAMSGGVQQSHGAEIRDTTKVVAREEKVTEGKKGLYANIHAKRKRGEAPAKPGSSDYPAKDAFAKSAKTAKKEQVSFELDGETYIFEREILDESMKQARKNVGASTCWKGYKASGTKKKGGKVVPNCVKEEHKVKCPECKGEGCNHCDDKGFHMKEYFVSSMREYFEKDSSGKMVKKHNCAKKVKYKKEEYDVVHGEHTLLEDGTVTHYDIISEHGTIIHNVPVEELEVTVEGMHEHFVNDAKNAEVLGEKKLDPVGKADADIDNDGDVDKSDKFLHARRKKVTKIIAAKNRSSKK